MLKEDLASIVDEENVTTEDFELGFYTYDVAPIPRLVTFLFRLRPDAVVKPKTSAEVSEVVKYANKNKIAVTPRGAASSGLGGTISVSGGIVLDMARMNDLRQIAEEAKTVTIQPGLTYQKLLDALERRGHTLATYPSSAPSATVGGWISTGGLGMGSIKYGHVLQQIAGMEVVLANGEVVQLSKNNDGEPRHKLEWFVGSEGTLGIITSVTLHILNKPEVTSPHIVCFNRFDAMAKFTITLVNSDYKPHSIECFDRGYIEIERSLGMPAPNAEAYCVLTFEGNRGLVEEEVKEMRGMMAENEGWEMDSEEALSKWSERFHPLRVRRAGPTLVPSEVIVPLTSFSDVIADLNDIKRQWHARMGVYGAIVTEDSVAVMPMALVDERETLQHLSTLPLTKKVIEIGLRRGGRPYGVGLWNSFYLKKALGSDMVEELRRRKRLLDPNNLMNRGKFFGAKTRFGIDLHPSMYNISMSLLRLLGRFTR